MVFNKLLYSSAAAVQEGLVDENAQFQTYVNRRVFIGIKMLAVFQRLYRKCLLRDEVLTAARLSYGMLCCIDW